MPLQGPTGASGCLRAHTGGQNSRSEQLPPAQPVTVACKPPPARAKAHAHGTRSGANREVCAGDSSLAKGETTSRAGTDAKGVRAKFRYGVARSEQRVVLNFDLTPFALTPFASMPPPFAATQNLPTTNHIDPFLWALRLYVPSARTSTGERQPVTASRSARPFVEPQRQCVPIENIRYLLRSCHRIISLG